MPSPTSQLSQNTLAPGGPAELNDDRAAGPPALPPTASLDRQVRLATPADVAYVYHLQNRYTDHVGVIPRGALADMIDRGRILLALGNDQEAGYLAATHRRDGTTHLPQVAVDEALWRSRLGTDLLAQLITDARAHGSRAITLKCAVGLPANRFWPELGFIPGQVTRDRVRPTICWYLPLTPWCHPNPKPPTSPHTYTPKRPSLHRSGRLGRPSTKPRQGKRTKILGHSPLTRLSEYYRL